MRLRSTKTKADKKASKKAAAAAAASIAPTDIKQEAKLAIAGTSKTSTAVTASVSSSTASTSKLKFEPTTSKTVRPLVKREREAGTGQPKDNVMADPELKRLKNGGEFSVASDPKASDVYKSLFTSHKSEQEQTRAHWVTYNPFYN